MRVNIIIKLDGKPLDIIKPVTLTDSKFKKLRSSILKRNYGLDVDNNTTELSISSKGISDSEILLLPKRISEIIAGIINPRQRNHRRRL